jgi:hypothetical protein
MNNNLRLTKFLVRFVILSISLCSAVDLSSSQALASSKKRSAGSSKKYFLVQTVEGEALHRRLSQSIDTVSHSFCHIITSSGILVDASEHQQADIFSLGTFYHVDGESLGTPEDLGRVSLRMGSSPVYFETDQCRWMGSMIRCEFRSPKNSLTAGLKLMREVYIDRQGTVYISFRATGSTKFARELFHTGKLRFRIDSSPSPKSSWRIWYRFPDGSLRRPDQKQESFECQLPADGKSTSSELLIVAVPMQKSNRSLAISSDEVEFESKITRRHPISSMQSAMRRWIVNQFPAWDCPEPWLNKLWAGQVVSICQQISIDNESGDPFININSPEDWQFLYDARWLRDPQIARRSIESQLHESNQKSLTQAGPIIPAALAVLECNPDAQFRKSITAKMLPAITKWVKAVPSTQATQSQTQPFRLENDAKLLLANYAILAQWSPDHRNVFLHRAKRLAAILNVPFPSEITSADLFTIFSPESSPADYSAFVQWCRSFFPGGDFDWLIDFRIDSAHQRVEKKIPRGVMDMIITKVVGLKTNSYNRLMISPARWILHWPYFAVDNLPYRGHNLTVVWQSPDHVQRYADIPQGLSIFIDGECVKQIQKLETVEIELK